MTDTSENTSRSKMSSLISGGEEKKPVEAKNPLFARLPQKANLPGLPAENADKTPPQNSQPGKKTSPPTPPKPDRAASGIHLNFGPPFWTITGILSLTVNIILIVILLAVFLNIGTLNINNMTGMGVNLVSGLYSNFEKMDRAHIKTNVKVETTIPVKFDLQLNQQTNVVLSQDVTITNALVTVQTGGMNISRALTTIVLPQGTNLPIVLNLTVPVDTTVPVTLNVPVDIAMSETDLHQPFSDLQKVVQPIYCLLDPAALNLDGQPICK